MTPFLVNLYATLCARVAPLHKNNAVNLNVKKTNMVQRVSGFLVVFLLMFFGSMNGQRHPAPGISVSGLKRVQFQQTVKPFQSRFTRPILLKAAECMPETKFTLLNLPTSSTYVNNLGFFCRYELKMDKVLAVPIRFRLGSREYVDRLEGKGGR